MGNKLKIGKFLPDMKLNMQAKRLKMSEKENFLYNIYYNNIYPQLEDIEIYRRTLLNKVFIQILLGPVFGLLLAFLDYWDKKNTLEAVLIGLISTVFFVLVLFLWNPNKKLFNTKLKKDYFHIFIKAFPEIKWWQREKEVSEILPDRELINSGLFSQFTRRKNDDEFAGSYNGVEFCVSEASLIMDDGFTKPSTIFQGLIIKIPFNKKIAQRTIIASQKEVSPLRLIILAIILLIPTIIKYTKNWWIGLIAIVVAALSGYTVLRLGMTNKEARSDIKLEDPKFSKRFKVFSEDDVEARYLLTPTFIAKFTKLEKIMKADSVKCSFYDNNIMIAVNSEKDFFEIGDLFKNTGDISTAMKFYEDVSIIFELIDYFKLSIKTGI